jgi:hypothetical protein
LTSKYKLIPFMIDDILVCSIEKSDSQDTADAREENLKIFGPAALQGIRQHHKRLYPYMRERYPHSSSGPTALMMFCLPRLSEIYGVHRNELLQAWAEHYGMSEVFKDEHSLY